MSHHPELVSGSHPDDSVSSLPTGKAGTERQKIKTS